MLKIKKKSDIEVPFVSVSKFMTYNALPMWIKPKSILI